MGKSNNVYAGLDVHKEFIAITSAHEGRGEATYYGELANTSAVARKLVNCLAKKGSVLHFCYEAGPRGYDLHPQLTGVGQACEVVGFIWAIACEVQGKAHGSKVLA